MGVGINRWRGLQDVAIDVVAAVVARIIHPQDVEPRRGNREGREHGALAIVGVGVTGHRPRHLGDAVRLQQLDL